MAFQFLLRSWLQHAARQKVREAVIEAARQQLGGAAQEGQPAPCGQGPPVCHVGAIFALGIEAGGLEDLLSGVVTTRGHGFVLREGGLAGGRVALVLSGPGAVNAAKAAEALITGHQPQWVLSAGFAGGLDSKLRRGDVLMADRVVDVQHSELAIDLKVDAAALAESRGVHVGRLLTADRIIRLPTEKRLLGREFGALAVDMETFAVAEACRRLNARFLAVRVVSDTVDDELPRDVEYLLAQRTGAARFGAALGAFFKRPSSAKDLWKLKENALVASDRLAKFLAGLIEQLTSTAAQRE